MRPPPSAPHLLRTLAIVIALAGAVDPAVTVNRFSKPLVAVIAAEPVRDSALARQAAGRLAKSFDVVPAPFPRADATVLVGDALPNATTDLASPVFALLPDRTGPAVTLLSVQAPASSPLEARIPIIVTLRAARASGETLEVDLRAGEVLVDRVTRRLASDDDRVEVPLAFVPSALGAAALRVSATLTRAAAPKAAVADLAIDVRDHRWPVLFYDPRPSWMSRFVRRAIEGDARFTVTSRVVTSRDISSDAGRPPARLDDLTTLGTFDVVVIGAPEALSEGDVAGVERFLRRRAGRVILLLDQRARGPYERLLDAGAWEERAVSHSVPMTGALTGGPELKASELAWPALLPDGAEAVARADGAADDSVAGAAVVWRLPVGAGSIVVSGALDAWRFRDPEVSTFDRFWRTIVAEAASTAAPGVGLSVTPAALAPGESAEVTVVLRDVALSAASDIGTAAPMGTTVAAVIDSGGGKGGGNEHVRLWPDGLGRFRGSLRAPSGAGVHRLVVDGNGQRAIVPLVVVEDAAHPVPEARDLVTAWVASRGGRVVHAADLEQLPATLRAAIRPAARMQRWHPMRSAWWVIPFALALGGEWWVRRRRGLA